jgi:hypothetical protein
VPLNCARIELARFRRHVGGPAPSDVVIVTGEAVLKALLDERITVRQAMAADLLRVSSSDAQAPRVEQWLMAAFASARTVAARRS